MSGTILGLLKKLEKKLYLSSIHWCLLLFQYTKVNHGILKKENYLRYEHLKWVFWDMSKAAEKPYNLTTDDMRNELGIFPTDRNTEGNRSYWWEYLDRMSEGRTLKQIMIHSSKERRSVGRESKRSREIWGRNRPKTVAMKWRRRKSTTTATTTSGLEVTCRQLSGAGCTKIPRSFFTLLTMSNVVEKFGVIGNDDVMTLMPSTRLMRLSRMLRGSRAMAPSSYHLAYLKFDSQQTSV